MKITIVSKFNNVLVLGKKIVAFSRSDNEYLIDFEDGTTGNIRVNQVKTIIII